jgi:hypothetical protein
MQQTAVKKKINIWQYQYILTKRLAFWGVGSFAAGIPMIFMEPFLRGFGLQAMLWGAINMGIAVFAALRISQRRENSPDPADQGIIAGEAEKLKKLLILMIRCDFGYLALGLLIIFTWGRKDAWWMGTGISIFVQGLFLLGFDWYHVKEMPMKSPVSL